MPDEKREGSPPPSTLLVVDAVIEPSVEVRMERVVRPHAFAGNSRLSSFPVGRALHQRCRWCPQLSHDLHSFFRGSGKNSGIREGARLGALQRESPLLDAPLRSIGKHACSDQAEFGISPPAMGRLSQRGKENSPAIRSRARDCATLRQGCSGNLPRIFSHLPLTVPVVHVAWSGDMVMSARPFHVGPREPENAVRPASSRRSHLGPEVWRDLLCIRHRRGAVAVG